MTLHAAARPGTVALDYLRDLLGSFAYRFVNEKELQDGIEKVLEGAGFRCQREVRLGPGDVVDFLVEDIAVEVKVDGSLSAATRQLHRYAQHDRVGALLLVSSLNRLARQPGEMNGKPVSVLVLSGGLA